MRPDHEVHSAVSAHTVGKPIVVAYRASGVPIPVARETLVDFLEQCQSSDWLVVGELRLVSATQPGFQFATDTGGEPRWQTTLAHIARHQR